MLAATALKPRIVGVLNLTPDSFSDGGLYTTPEQALLRAKQMLAEGVDIIDIGAESSRPGATPISEQQELDRLMPVLALLRHEIPLPLSVDTYKPGVMKEAIAQGVAMINDIKALQEPGALPIVATSQAIVCLMHMKGVPTNMQTAPVYRDVVAEVSDFLSARMQACLAAGISRDRLILDPGIGFGKTLKHNLLLLKNLNHLTSLGAPLLIGASRKAMLGTLLNVAVDQRLYGSIAIAVLAIQAGVKWIRCHDILATAQAIKVAWAILEAQ